MKITDLKPNEVIHCKTKEEAVRICGIAPNKLCTPDWWRHYKDNTCYDTIIGEFCSVEYATDNQLAIHPSELFQDSDSSDEITEEGLRARGFKRIEWEHEDQKFVEWRFKTGMGYVIEVSESLMVCVGPRICAEHTPAVKTLTDIDHLIRLLGI